MDQECLDNTYTDFFLKEVKTNQKVVNSFVKVSIVKMCHNPMHQTDSMSQRWIRGVQTKLIPIFSQKGQKQIKNYIKALNRFVSLSMVKMLQNSINLTNYMSQKRIRSVYTTFIPIFFQKRLKPKTNCLKAVNCLVSVSMVKCGII